MSETPITANGCQAILLDGGVPVFDRHHRFVQPPEWAGWLSLVLFVDPDGIVSG
jgi:hypothetical protein